MKYGLASLVLLLVPAGQVCLSGQWYAAPDGKSTNPGTRQAPWDIASALGGEQRIAAGDDIYLLEGTYERRPRELYEIRLIGSENAPINIRPAAGNRVRIDGGFSIQSPSAHVWIRDLEIFVSEPRPDKPISAGSHPEDLNRPWGGLHMFGGSNCRYINMVIHNCNQGISCWKGEIDPEIYGCLIYDNGWLGTDRGHGHCIYTQNDEGVKKISNCIMSSPYDGAYTLHAYGSQQAYVNNFLVEDNICYDEGPFLIGGGRPSRGIRVFRNYLYDVGMRIGYDAPYNENCDIRDNIIVNGGLDITRYRQVVQEGNLVIAKGDKRLEGTKSILLPNRFDPNQAHLIIYTWDKTEQLQVKVDPFLKDGESYRLMDPKDFFGDPIGEGICRENAISLNIKGEFGVFVILKGQ